MHWKSSNSCTFQYKSNSGFYSTEQIAGTLLHMSQVIFSTFRIDKNACVWSSSLNVTGLCKFFNQKEWNLLWSSRRMKKLKGGSSHIFKLKLTSNIQSNHLTSSNPVHLTSLLLPVGKTHIHRVWFPPYVFSLFYSHSTSPTQYLKVETRPHFRNKVWRKI